MSVNIGANVLYIVVPVVLVAVVAYILVKLTPPIRSLSLRPRGARRVRRAAPVFARADSWPDLELPALRGADTSGKTPPGGTKDGSGIQAPASVWNPTRQSRLDWSFTIPKNPARRPN